MKEVIADKENNDMCDNMAKENTGIDARQAFNLAVKQITETELSGKDRWIPHGRCYLVKFHKIPGESDLGHWTHLVVSSCTGTALYHDIQKQLENKYSSPFVIDSISDLGPEN